MICEDGDCVNPRPSLDHVLRAVSVHHLPGAPRIPDLSAAQPHPVDPQELVRRAEGEKLLGSLQAAVTSGLLELPSDALDLLAQRHRATMAWCLRIEARLVETERWFREEGGVEHLVIKGSAIAHLDEPDPSMRSFADADLLVAGRDIDRAVAALARHGATRPWPQRRRGFDRRFAKSVTMTSNGGIEIDLHRTLCDGVFGVRMPLDELFDRAECFTLGGEQMGALSRPHRLLHAAYHAVLGSSAPALYSLRDLAGYLSSPELAPGAIVPVVQRWRGEAVLAAAVRATLGELQFDAGDWPGWLADVRVDPDERELVRRQRTEGSSIGPAKLDMWRELPGVRLKAAYARAVLWPSSAHLSSRGLTRRQVWSGWLRRSGA